VISALRTWPKRIAFVLLIAAISWISIPVIGNILGLGLGLSFLLIQLLGIAIFLVGMPLFFLIIGEAGYKIFLKPYIRVWRINRIRNARLLRETLDHDSSGN
jgi:hypothetical protein